ncbi:vWA domain-containing protein [Psychrobacter sp. 1Y11]|uniref:vWA domain-containing protein n=1 Tax=Psychrobacter sp. 1Y11 TaxID=3457446 RepID=UPI003FD5F17B
MSLSSTKDFRLQELSTSTLLVSILAALSLSACSSQQSVATASDNSSRMIESEVSVTSAPVVVSAPASQVRRKATNSQATSQSMSQANVLYDISSEPAIIRPAPIVVEQTGDNYQKNIANPINRTIDNPVATLSIDTDTGSYSNVRRYLNEGQMPPADAVRIEEMINYFPYDFSNSQRLGQAPFVVETEIVDSPWDRVDQANQILKVGIKAVDPAQYTRSVNTQLPPANLVFLVDVSGSMNSSDKLTLAKATLNLLAKQLRAEDTISIVTYSGSTRVALAPTSGDKTATIQAAINSLKAAGSTNGEDALKLAYEQASQTLKKGSINRILMLTDGDFNVGISDVDEMLDLVKANRDRGISLSTLGFGRGNLNDYMMEQMADNGNGNYSYIDSLSEAKKVLDDELNATFNTVASDVKIQLEFNPTQVDEWRLIGYENRVLAEEDFNNDKIDAGELGAGKAVVALFELTPKGEKGATSPRRYADNIKTATSNKGNNKELGFLKIRYKATPQSSSQLLEVPIATVNKRTSLMSAHPDTQFAVAVASFGQRLQQSPYINDWQYRDSTQLANQSLSYQTVNDTNGLRRGFVELTELAEALQPIKNKQ